MTAQTIVVIGGTAAGPKAAARAKRLNQEARVVLIQKAPELSMASCGYPYYVSGSVAGRNQLLSTPAGVVRDPGFFAGAKGVTALVETEATAVNPAEKTVAYTNLRTGESGSIAYDKLILCTGGTARMPKFPSADLEGVTALHSLADADRLRQMAAALKGQPAVVCGGGLIPFVFLGSKDNPMVQGGKVAGFQFDFPVVLADYGVSDGRFTRMGMLGDKAQVTVNMEALR